MTTRSLVGAFYFMVAGGPYGLEELLAKAGPWMAIVVIVVTPLVWSLPTALLVGELGAAIPEEGGYYVWVKRGLGPFFGFQEAWLSLAASVFDMAIYPTLFVSYLARFWPMLGEGPFPIMVGVLLIASCAAVNTLGAKSVGDSSVVMTALLLAPFAVLSAILFTHAGIDPNAPIVAATGEEAPAAGGDLLGGILVAMWNFMGWDNGSTVAGEVDAPQTTYPRAVMIAVALVTVTYLVPCIAVAVAHVDVAAWDTGAWVGLGEAVGGSALRAAMILGGMVCGFGTLNALVLSYSRIPVALAQDGFLPAALMRVSPTTGAPVVAVVACAAAWTLSLGLKFERLVALDILLYGTSLALEFAALIALRRNEPDLPRPYRIPGGTVGAVLLGVPPMALLGVALVKNAGERILGMNALLFGVFIMAMGPLLYRTLAPRTRDDG